MAPKKSKNPDKSEPLITEAMLSEYHRKENDPRWYHNLVGVIASKEPIYWDWMVEQVKQDTIILATEAPQAFANPILAQELGKILQRAYIRAHFLGLRKYESSLASVFDIYQMPNESTRINRKLEDKPEDPAGFGEVEPGDLEP